MSDERAGENSSDNTVPIEATAWSLSDELEQSGNDASNESTAAPRKKGFKFASRNAAKHSARDAADDAGFNADADSVADADPATEADPTPGSRAERAPSRDETAAALLAEEAVSEASSTRKSMFGEAPVHNSREHTWNAWRDELARIGGRSSLIDFIDIPATRIELSSTHPGGLAQFITGRPTLLSSLIRDDLALRSARGAASAILSKGIELAAARGVDSVYLGIGLATWPRGDREASAPLLLRPLVIRRRGRDFELQLKGRPVVNPRLKAVLEAENNVTLDGPTLSALGDAEGTFSPNPVLDAVRLQTAHIPGFRVHPRLVASTFADVGIPMAEDLRAKPHVVLDAVSGDPDAIRALKNSRRAADETASDERSPETDLLVLDADAEQSSVLSQIVAGNSLVVESVPGAGTTQTIVNAIGALVGDDRRVLVVSPRRATIADIVERSKQLGLQGLAVQPATLRQDIIASIGRHERATKPQTSEVDDALVRLRKVLLDYRGALHRVHPKFGVTVIDCLRELSRLTSLPTPPATDVRLNESAVIALANDRPRIASTMVKAAELGQFKYGPDDTPWYGANFETATEADAAFDAAQRLSGGELDALITQARAVLDSTKLRPFSTIRELGKQLELLRGIRASLDIFVPDVFDRPLTELITATGPRRDAKSMTMMQRRRLRKHALDFVRPGGQTPDLGESLREVQQLREQWRQYTPDGAVPSIPVGLAPLHRDFELAKTDLGHIDRALGFTGAEQSDRLPLDVLETRLAGLAAPSDALTHIQERAALMKSLAEINIDPLIADLGKRHVPGEQVENELELAWWQSTLEAMLQSERALLRGNTGVLERLEADLALVDETHASASSERLAWQMAENWKLGLVDFPEEAAALRTLLKSGAIDSASLQKAAPHLAKTVATVWACSPYEVHRIDKAVRFDTVIVVDAGAITLAEAAGAISRAEQVVAFGDSVTQTPSPFEVGIASLGIRPSSQLIAHDELHGESALLRLGSVLPAMSLTQSFRTGGQDLVDAVNRRFYGGKIDALPWAGSYLGHSSLTVSPVADAWGMPKQGSAVIESPEAEVERVIELITTHAKTRPHESLMVVTGNERHEVRVQQAVVQALGQNQSLTDFVLAERDEPFVVADLAHGNALSRDRVIFSVGFGHSKHSRNIDFGAFGEPGGERMLAIAMTRARKAMTIVTAFEASELDPERLEHGAAALREIILDAERGRPRGGGELVGDPLMVDLARRLRRRGLRADVDHLGRLPLVVANGGVCAAIEFDHEGETLSLRESLRLRPEVLRRLGWHTMRVHAFALFTDPESVADRIAALVGLDAAESA
ncbi:AAA family ATPase [Humidisolicoccus flavus]|uniref:AAA family ATPase n=1 Tax=Humidisolicoccus flavus TaxID=3111414 RepID=UPI003251E966